MPGSNIFISIYKFIIDYFDSLTTAQSVSMIIIASSAVLFMILERIFPYNKGQKPIREGFFDDLALYTIAQSYILSIIIFSYVIYFIDSTTGISRLRLFADVPIWIQLAFFTITHDFYIYWMHRWQHKNKWLWRIHEAHHSPKEVDWLSGSRSHALEILINQTVEFTPIILLGSPPEIVAYKGVISALWGMYIHSNLNINSGILQLIINGPEMHRWHHTTGKGRNRNFSTKLAIWDWIFDTAYFPEGQKAEIYGLISPFPAHYVQQFFYAFRRFRKKKRKKLNEQSHQPEESLAAQPEDT
jgi:sterol desaturase/sphingolipid hydroxylase (fatty acid hydroxylase superfamily)